MKRTALPLILLLALPVILLCAACGGGKPEADVIAVIGERTLRHVDLQAYLSVNLLDDGSAPMSLDEREEIRSRLFDRFVEEQLLLAEAERSGVTVSDEEVATYRAALEQTDGTDPEARKVADRLVHQTLVTQKFSEWFLRQQEEPSVAEIDAYLDEHREELTPQPQVVLRALMLESMEQAERAYQRLKRRSITFNEAVVAYGTTPGQGIPVETPIDQQPEPLRKELERLRIGQTSKPIDLHGNVYLFNLDSRRDPADDPETLRSRAREQLIREQRASRMQDLIELLRAGEHVRIYTENLPFRYREVV
ncbi:hypothetical protein ABI59_14780 [Acidobacteria bacterium Mor1]|nr:hypothetical protein ABI59_14780 [Acidobacteria bacterium Mor1]